MERTADKAVPEIHPALADGLHIGVVQKSEAAEQEEDPADGIAPVHEDGKAGMTADHA